MLDILNTGVVGFEEFCIAFGDHLSPSLSVFLLHPPRLFAFAVVGHLSLALPASRSLSVSVFSLPPYRPVETYGSLSNGGSDQQEPYAEVSLLFKVLDTKCCGMIDHRDLQLTMARIG
eukprot:765790-Hanusia_phi.AAC.6